MINLYIILTFLLFLFIIIYDIKYMIIPDLLLISILVTEILRVRNIKLLTNSLLNLIIVIIIFTLFRLLMNKIYKKDTLGIGDIKLFGAISFISSLYTTLITCFLSSYLALFFILINKLFKRDINVMPYGPFIITSYYISLFLGRFYELL